MKYHCHPEDECPKDLKIGVVMDIHGKLVYDNKPSLENENFIALSGMDIKDSLL